VASIAAGAHHNLAIKSDGTVLGWGRNDSAQLAVNPASSPICGATTACEKFPIPITIP
jgi:alpha-tubulin suppressor-like RCC1 family protein